MASGEVIKKFVNTLAVEVDEASAAKAEASIRGWKAAAEEVGKVLADVGGNVATFLNSLSGAGQLAELNAQTSMAAKPIRAWGRAALKLGATLTELGPWVGAFTAQVQEYNEATGLAGTSTTDLRKILEALRKQSDKTSADLEKISKGLDDVKASSAAAAAAQTKAAHATSAITDTSESGISKLTRFGDALRSGREIVNALGEAYHFLLGDLLESSRLTMTAAKTAGVSTKFYQEQAYALRTVGLEADELRDVFLDLSDKAYDASTGSKEQAASFKALGVKVTDTSGKLKPMEQLFLEIADGLKGITNETKRTGLASKILGEQGARLLPIFANGAEGLREYAREANEVGAVLSDEALASTAEYQRSVTKLGATLEGLRNTLGVALLPTLETLAKRLSGWLVANREIIKTKITKFVEVFTKAMDGLLYVFSRWKFVVIGAAAVLAGPYLAALSTVTAAQLTWGSAALIAGARAGAAALAAAGPWVALAALILLVAEDLYGYETGQDSLFGQIDEWVNSFDPTDNPVVMFLKEVIKNITNLVKSGTDVLFDITNVEKWKAYLKALISYLLPFSDKVFALFNPFDAAKERSGEPEAVKMREKGKKRSALGGFFAGSMQDPEDRDAELAVLRGAAPPWAGRYDTTAGALSSASASPSAYFGRAASVEGSVASMQSMRSGPAAGFAPVVTQEFNITTSPNQSPAEVGRALSSSSASDLGATLRATQARYSKG